MIFDEVVACCWQDSPSKNLVIRFPSLIPFFIGVFTLASSFGISLRCHRT
jgi:hypothetical protein